MDVSPFALRKRLPLLGGILAALAFLGAARLFKNQFFRNPYGPDVLPLLVTYLLQFVLGADVFCTSSRTATARSDGRLFVASALVLVCQIAWPYWGAIGKVPMSPMFLIRVFADPINAVAACGLWGSTFARGDEPGGQKVRRFNRICGIILVSSLVLQLFRLAVFAYTWMQPGVPLQWRLSGLERELFPYHLSFPFLVWACVEYLRPLEEGAEGRGQLKRRAWALIGWLCAELMVWSYDAWLFCSREYSLAVYVGDLVLPAARFAVQVLVCAVTAALALRHPNPGYNSEAGPHPQSGAEA